MKRLIIVLMALAFAATSFAQGELSEGAKAKNAGNEAYRSKNWVEAIAQWDKYFNSGEEGVAEDANTKKLFIKAHKNAAGKFASKDVKDYANALKYYNLYVEKAGASAEKEKSLSYNMAYAANMIGKDKLALEYYQKSINKGYKPDLTSLRMAIIYKDTDQTKMKEVLTEAMVKYPDSKYKSKMAGMLAVPMLNEAAVPLMEANNLAKASQTGEANSYLTKMAKAIIKFEEAVPLYEKVLELDPTNSDAKKYLEICKKNIKDFNDYKTSLEK